MHVCVVCVRERVKEKEADSRRLRRQVKVYAFVSMGMCMCVCVCVCVCVCLHGTTLRDERAGFCIYFVVQVVDEGLNSDKQRKLSDKTLNKMWHFVKGNTSSFWTLNFDFEGYTITEVYFPHCCAFWD